jgi:hypothetical protein
LVASPNLALGAKFKKEGNKMIIILTIIIVTIGLAIIKRTTNK